MVDVLFFIPPYRGLYSTLNINNSSLHPGIAYIASFLEKNGYKVRLVDMQKEVCSLHNVERIVRYENPSFVGITSTTPLIGEAENIAKAVKKVDSNIKVVLGGSHASAVPKEVLKNPDFDIVVVGEGEHTFLELLKGYDLNSIKGIAYRKNKKAVISPARPLVKDLDSLPFPAYSLLDVKGYKSMIYYKDPFCGITCSRGCPYNCIFCAVDVVHGKKVRLRSPVNIVNEVEYLYKKHGIKSFLFYDEVFTVYKQRAKKICKEIKKRKLSIRWVCSSRVDTVDEGLLKVMKDAGCEAIHYGIESGDQKILDIIQKDITIKQIEEGVKVAHKTGLRVLGLFMLGHPYETWDTIKRTVDLAKKLPFYNVIFSIATPFPGTKFWDLAKEGKGVRLLTKDYSRFKPQMNSVTELPSVPAKRLKTCHNQAYRKFYFRLPYLLWRLKNTEFKKIGFDVKRSINLFRFTK